MTEDPVHLAWLRWVTLAMCCLALASVPCAAADMAEMKAELAKIEGETQAVATTLKVHAAEKAANWKELGRLEGERKELDREEAAIIARRPEVVRACSGTVTPEQAAAARARCNAVQGPFNRDIDDHLEKAKSHKERLDAARAKEAAREAAERPLADRSGRLLARKRELQAAILEAAIAERPRLPPPPIDPRRRRQLDAWAELVEGYHDLAEAAAVWGLGVRTWWHDPAHRQWVFDAYTIATMPARLNYLLSKLPGVGSTAGSTEELNRVLREIAESRKPGTGTYYDFPTHVRSVGQPKIPSTVFGINPYYQPTGQGRTWYWGDAADVWIKRTPELDKELRWVLTGEGRF